MIFHLLYISKETSPLKEEDLIKIVNKSIAKNKIKNITGMLVKNGNFFLQLLEGEKQEVMKVLKIISKDKRHSKLKTLLTYQDSKRIFPSWYMGLVDVKSHDLNIQELITLLHTDFMKAEYGKEQVISILKKFNNN